MARVWRSSEMMVEEADFMGSVVTSLCLVDKIKEVSNDCLLMC